MDVAISDIRELASLLMDAPLNAASIRLPKVMAMFASRACRSSVMIGTALHKEEMQKVRPDGRTDGVVAVAVCDP